ncbi:phosphate butyryltransferase [Clostridium sp. Cult2]|nr:phosphate butyryltransferase [Clostridium sp. Cult2]
MIKNFEQLMELAIKNESKKIAVAVPDDLEILKVIEKAGEIKLAEFILVGDKEKIKNIIKENNLTVKSEIINKIDHKKAADTAVDLVNQGKASTIMKGMLHSSTFLKAVLNKEKSLNTGNHITQISVLEKENNEGLMFITDCAITVAPDLMKKKEILENAVNLAHKIGIQKPKVAVLASLEIVNPNMQDTVDAALLSKMTDRGQIKGCEVDGPFAFDNAISQEAAKTKGITSTVAGNADIILVPNLTVGNTLTKAISYIGKKKVAAATVGTSVPIIFTSRTASMEEKLLSIALAVYTS